MDFYTDLTSPRPNLLSAGLIGSRFSVQIKKPGFITTGWSKTLSANGKQKISETCETMNLFLFQIFDLTVHTTDDDVQLLKIVQELGLSIDPNGVRLVFRGRGDILHLRSVRRALKLSILTNSDTTPGLTEFSCPVVPTHNATCTSLCTKFAKSVNFEWDAGCTDEFYCSQTRKRWKTYHFSGI